ncbi:M20/M25/M40 family metallo-hydrolase [Actinotalea sp. M2MS4P-6]|uniref:M20/M25/M40 family metallo-hydrolase n=1 Tax=Actinotalea sp. M2MS4P-6 TaxID=2983762 RepID=UPI0021E4FF0C|nr:M20/M25/M40 family metallo-hydrolase [Actinotalea sp. M2MS4P-6]MCV2395675.1 M20/M25/M40 family metallo-hydrolase [Actinotalea sp. M2MS4P-6]
MPETSPDLEVMLGDLRALVETEASSDDDAALARSAEVVAELGERRLGVAPERVHGPGHHLLWRFGGEPRVLVLAHHDTVWPTGSWERLWALEDGRASGPGVFDMKAGLVMALHAVGGLADRSGVELLVTSDEEVGSPTGRAIVQERAAACGSVLVLEPSADGGAVKVARAGVARFHVDVEGRAAHAGLEPEKGVNAGVELAHQLLAVAGLDIPDAQITPTVVQAGTAGNTVPASASLTVDVRVRTLVADAAVEAAFAGLRAVLPEAGVSVRRSVNSPPLEAAATAELLALAREVAAELGLAELSTATVAGASDGNLAAAVGARVLDGLGGVGGGAHAAGEWIDTTQLVPRTLLVRGLLERLVAG